MVTDHQGRVAHWRKLAADAQQAADRALDPETRVTYLGMAEMYENLALQASTNAWVQAVQTKTPNDRE